MSECAAAIPPNLKNIILINCMCYRAWCSPYLPTSNVEDTVKGTRRSIVVNDHISERMRVGLGGNLPRDHIPARLASPHASVSLGGNETHKSKAPRCNLCFDPRREVIAVQPKSVPRGKGCVECLQCTGLAIHIHVHISPGREHKNIIFQCRAGEKGNRTPRGAPPHAWLRCVFAP